MYEIMENKRVFVYYVFILEYICFRNIKFVYLRFINLLLIWYYVCNEIIGGYIVCVLVFGLVCLNYDVC